MSERPKVESLKYRQLLDANARRAIHSSAYNRKLTRIAEILTKPAGSPGSLLMQSASTDYGSSAKKPVSRDISPNKSPLLHEMETPSKTRPFY